jgi:hypothetical protein
MYSETAFQIRYLTTLYLQKHVIHHRHFLRNPQRNKSVCKHITDM